MDTLSPEERSKRMGLVRNKGTRPEWLVRRVVHAMGYRYRLHSKVLPGHPDLVFKSRRKIIFVHGCFWHRHGLDCPLSRSPKSRLEFWIPKFERTVERDAENQERLVQLGWNFLIVWECQTGDLKRLGRELHEFLG